MDSKTLSKLIFAIMVIIFLILVNTIDGRCFDYNTTDYRLWRIYALNTEISLQKEQEAHRTTLSHLRQAIDYNTVYQFNINYLNIQASLYYNRYQQSITAYNQILGQPFRPWDITVRVFGGVGNGLYVGGNVNLYIYDNLALSGMVITTGFTNYQIALPQVFGGVGINYTWIWR